MAVQARHVVCALGTWSSFQELRELVFDHNCGFELDSTFSILFPDDRMENSFDAASDRFPGTLSNEDTLAISSHSAVAYFLSPPMTARSSLEVSGQALDLVKLLFAAGATAIKGESSGIAHGKLKWLELANLYAEATRSRNLFEQGCVLYNAWVYKWLFDETCSVLYTVGMHLLGHRDIELLVSDESMREGLEWIDGLGYYLLGDRPTNTPKPGEGFRLSAESDRKIFEHFSCQRYAKDDFKFNPFGYNRLRPVK